MITLLISNNNLSIFVECKMLNSDYAVYYLEDDNDKNNTSLKRVDFQKSVHISLLTFSLLS